MLRICDGCRRHVHADERRCPFCPRSSGLRSVGRAALLSLALAGCAEHEADAAKLAPLAKADLAPVLQPLADASSPEPAGYTGPVDAEVAPEPAAVSAAERRHAEGRKRRPAPSHPDPMPVPLYGLAP